ncbi:hypothetical protein E8E12_001731 [Didymella heteroderae]|uniref:Uncharacterized protein n=1 Tax=Didymella heteroderae TaxID=1769908 RepID=A0A9P5C5K7_9PLEO|nr:hypothetical protein E8E12_001731 [Didymella heteroderae]
MLLPPELLTLVFLAGLGAVHAQVEDTAAPTYSTTPDDSFVAPTPTGIPPLSPTATPPLSPTVTSPSSPTGDSNDIGAPAPTPTTDEELPAPTFDEVEACDLPDPPYWCNEPPPDFWHPEETATGWDDWASWNNDNIGGGNNIAPPTQTLKPVEQTPDVITTVTPTVIEIRTSVQPTAPAPGGGETRHVQVPTDTPAGDGNKEQQTPPAQQIPSQDAPQTKVTDEGNRPQGSQVQGNPVQPSPGPAAPTTHAPGAPAPAQSTAGSKHNAENVPAQRQSTSTGNALLDTIINHLGKAQPGAQPGQPAQATQPTLRTTGGSGEGFTQESAVAAPTDTARVGEGNSANGFEDATGQMTPGNIQTTSPQNSIAVGNTITLGSATISLTAGLSTVVGTGTDATLIAIQTDSASHTIITISSSGTAITATITDAPATVTLPKTGFEASITNSAGRGIASSRIAVTAVSTSSKGAASEQRVNRGGLAGFVTGMLAFVAML